MKSKITIISLVLLGAATLVVVLTRHASPTQSPVVSGERAALTSGVTSSVPVEPGVPGGEQRRVQTRLQAILGDGGEGFQARFEAVHALKGPLPRAQVETLYAFLRTTGAKPGTTQMGEHVLKNDVMEFLCREKMAPPDLLSNLCALSREAQQDEVTRDYAVQHVVALCLKPGGQFASDQPVARETLWEALAENGSLPGTALLGLHRISGVDREFDTNQVSAVALKLALAPGTEELVRVTALQVCAERQLKEVLPEATRLAGETGSLPLRLSAIAALGSAGGPPEQELLESLRAGGDRSLQPAVKAALRRLNARRETPPHEI